MTAEYYTISAERVAAIVAADPHLTTAQVRAIATADWPEGAEHQDWLDTAPAAEVAAWVAYTAAQEGEDR